MIWLILFLPAVMIWTLVLFIHVKSGKSNHHYHEPLIFYSQRISPFPIENTKTNYKDEIEKGYRKR
ncbi:DNA recombination protein RecO [Bacillus cereus]|uniref:DNA recombination protein RecO n=1 Tax=Bacillus cereus TaxID=1396 RepID=UPI00187A8412|nr:DNA recombination protein RecO [Bacillus cereus]MBE7102062.1 DNA recombination protein RecO [Bacillus cereus]